MDFQFENQCIQILLRIVSHGNALIAELFRLSTCIPIEYQLTSNQSEERKHVVFDFAYFKQAEACEKRIEASDQLKQLDEKLREKNIEIIVRFYRLFENIHRYAVELNRFAVDVDEGAYIQESFESLLQSDEGKQLLCEAYFLYGVMLMGVELKYAGVVRERLLVAYYRFSAQQMSSESTVDEICQLFRTTDVGQAKTVAKSYFDEYFNRVPINERHLQLVIARLRSDDIYHRTETFPLSEHRTHALAAQSSMLFMLLHFKPQTLHNDAATMREIVDKFFCDNWIVSVYLGITVNLIASWEPYAAARVALAAALSAENVRAVAIRHADSLRHCSLEFLVYSKESNCNEQTVTHRLDKLLTLVRRANVTIRWLMLHTVLLDAPHAAESTIKRCRALREQLIRDAEFSSGKLLELLLRCAEFELTLKDLIKKLLEEKEQNWLRCQRESSERLRELSDAFSGGKSLTRIAKNAKLQQWFLEISEQVETSLKFDDRKRTCRKIIRLYQALEQVQSFHELDTQLHVRQFLDETRQLLLYMEKLYHFDEQLLVNLQTIGDLSYAWPVINTYVDQMQDGAKRRPGLVYKLRAVFLKIASALDGPLIRINQANSPDLVSVSQYYSGELVAYVRNVLQIIPHSMFMLLQRIVDIETNQIKPLPTRVEHDRLKDYAQLEQRFEVAQLTYKLSTFTQGLLKMKTTLVGIIKIDPNQLLEDGIRKELVQLVSNALHTMLTFQLPRANRQPHQLAGSFVEKLNDIERKMIGLRRSFEYVQDYVGVRGLTLWHEEVSRLINFNVEQECNAYSVAGDARVHAWDSVYQSLEIPLPQYEPLDAHSATFVGRLARELLRLTDPHATLFVESAQAWYTPQQSSSKKKSQEILHAKIFATIHRILSTPGFVGFDRLLSFMLAAELERLFQTFRRIVLENNAALRQFVNDHARYVDNVLAVMSSSNKSAVDGGGADAVSSMILLENVKQCQAYQKQIGSSGSAATSFAIDTIVSATTTTTSGRSWGALNDAVLRIGQLQVLRGCIAHELRVSSSVDAKLLCDAVRNLNESILLDVVSGNVGGSNEAESSSSAVPVQQTSLLFAALTTQLDAIGFAGPMQKIYVDVNSLRSVACWMNQVQQQVPTLVFLFIVSQLNRLHAGGIGSSLLLVNTARANTGDAYDATVLIYGIVTLFRHVHVECVKSVVAALGRYVQSELWTAEHYATGGVADESGSNSNSGTINNSVGQETLRTAAHRDGAAVVGLLQCLKRFSVVTDDMFDAIVGDQLAGLHAATVIPPKS